MWNIKPSTASLEPSIPAFGHGSFTDDPGKIDRKKFDINYKANLTTSNLEFEGYRDMMRPHKREKIALVKA